jgi:hypothetical protein
MFLNRTQAHSLVRQEKLATNGKTRREKLCGLTYNSLVTWHSSGTLVILNRYPKITSSILKFFLQNRIDCFMVLQ